ncbi:aminotransferase [Geofilum rubicundum JCM 15548]|uniref:Aminotransferase n=1 Tax=Geofilum rubicundum JCM 15548 TaxID=1236989 RepID=A0A0E9LUI0_9BACT|nr:aminotransferase [Geofilum rubicundum JCM 15548]
MQVKFLDLKAVNQPYFPQMMAATRQFLEGGWYIMGSEVEAFEKAYADYCGTDHCVGVSNGLDALRLIFEGYKVLGQLKEGDEVIVPANTYIASILAVTQSRLKPVLVEPDTGTFNLDPELVKTHITGKTKAILAVHLYGQLADMPALAAIASNHDLLLVEDAAQSHGATLTDGRRAGNLGHAAVIAFIPEKTWVPWAMPVPLRPMIVSWPLL